MVAQATKPGQASQRGRAVLVRGVLQAEPGQIHRGSLPRSVQESGRACRNLRGRDHHGRRPQRSDGRTCAQSATARLRCRAGENSAVGEESFTVLRAIAVRDSLIAFAKSQGVSPSIRPSSQWSGTASLEAEDRDLRLLDPCPPKSEAEWQSNMRVEFRILQVEAEASAFKPLFFIFMKPGAACAVVLLAAALTIGVMRATYPSRRPSLPRPHPKRLKG